MVIDYQQLIESSVAKFSESLRQRRELDTEIAKLQKFLRWTAARRSHSTPERAPTLGLNRREAAIGGITEGIRRVLMTYQIWLTPVLIRDLLPILGYDTSHYKEPLTSIHAILRRLVLKGEVIRGTPSVGRISYLWAADNPNKANQKLESA